MKNAYEAFEQFVSANEDVEDTEEIIPGILMGDFRGVVSQKWTWDPDANTRRLSEDSSEEDPTTLPEHGEIAPHSHLLPE